MGREARRVPLDFDWPIGKVWGGYVMPDNLRERECTDCGGDGYSPEAQAVANTFYPHQIEWGNTERANRLAWHDKLGQKEVDHLIKEGRLRTWVHNEGDDRGHWEPLPRTAADVNAEQRRGGMGGHDAINRMILIQYRCKRLGITLRCATCEGHGTVEEYPGQRAEAEAWEWTEPPAGDGWQMWETTSEGSPQTPVFDSAEALADHCTEQGVSWFGDTKATRDQWLRSFTGGELGGMVQIAPGVMVL